MYDSLDTPGLYIVWSCLLAPIYAVRIRYTADTLLSFSSEMY